MIFMFFTQLLYLLMFINNSLQEEQLDVPENLENVLSK